MRVLVLSSFTKSLLWFRMNLMEDLIAAGHEVIEGAGILYAQGTCHGESISREK